MNAQFIHISYIYKLPVWHQFCVQNKFSSCGRGAATIRTSRAKAFGPTYSLSKVPWPIGHFFASCRKPKGLEEGRSFFNDHNRTRRRYMRKIPAKSGGLQNSNKKHIYLLDWNLVYEERERARSIKIKF